MSGTPAALGGHGMEIVDALSDRLVAERVPVGKRVQVVFELFAADGGGIPA